MTKYWLLFWIWWIIPGSARGDVFLDSPAIKCGQLIYATCQTNKTNTVTINGSCGNISYGSHTFERGSDRYVLLGQLELTMVKAEEDPFNSLLTDFEIRVTEKAGKPFNMSCSDAFTKDDRQYPVPSSFSSGNCSVAISMKGDVLKWDPPACEGWKDVEHYTVVNGNGSLFTIKNHVSLSKLTNGAAIIVKATNRCKETATIAIWNPIVNSTTPVIEYAGVSGETSVTPSPTAILLTTSLMFMKTIPLHVYT